MIKRKVTLSAHHSLNPRFDTLVTQKMEYSFDGTRCSIDRDASMVTLLILRPVELVSYTQSFECANRDMLCRGECVHVIFLRMHLYYISFKKSQKGKSTNNTILISLFFFLPMYSEFGIKSFRECKKTY
jgi:hypothetical protein